ncbi:MAG: homoserine kinase, partial [Hyphomicrobiales bacterium]|nr:homoserine kinase [Hyphomicrobiales bacterium]
MAVYTEVADHELAEFLKHYDLGAVLAFKGIAEGVENSNYLLRTARGTFILTLYERRVESSDLPFFLNLMDHLSARGVPCPVPVHGRDGESLRRLNGRPAALVTFLDGISLSVPDVDQCAAVGRALAELHLAGADFGQRRANALSLSGWRKLSELIGAAADQFEAGLAAEIAMALHQLEERWPDGLPQGLIHADLFPDNVLFLDGRLSGLIDFYFSCSDALSYDVAVMLNAWCFDPHEVFVRPKAAALL